MRDEGSQDGRHGCYPRRSWSREWTNWVWMGLGREVGGKSQGGLKVIEKRFEIVFGDASTGGTPG